MKKINFVCGIIFMLAFTSNSNAQEDISLKNPAPKPVDAIPFYATTANQASAANKSTVNETRADNKVSRYVAGHFKNISGLRISNLKEGAIVAEFSMAGKTARVVCDKKGISIYTIITYSENELPADVKQLVHDEFKGFAITLVQEISQREVNCYKIFLEDCTRLKEVFVYNGEITIDKELVK